MTLLPHPLAYNAPPKLRHHKRNINKCIFNPQTSFKNTQRQHYGAPSSDALDVPQAEDTMESKLKKLLLEIPNQTPTLQAGTNRMIEQLATAQKTRWPSRSYDE